MGGSAFSDARLVEQVAQNFFGFEDFTCDRSRSAALLPVISVDREHRLSNFA